MFKSCACAKIHHLIVQDYSNFRFSRSCTYNSFGWSPSDPLDPVSAERMTGRCGVAVAEKIAAVARDTLTRHRQKLLHG